MVSCRDSVDLLRFKTWHLLLGLQEISPKSYRKPTNDPDVLKNLWKAPSCKMGYKTNNIPTPKFSGKLLSSFWEGSPGPMYPARKITVARVLQARRTAREALASYVVCPWGREMWFDVNTWLTLGKIIYKWIQMDTNGGFPHLYEFTGGYTCHHIGK